MRQMTVMAIMTAAASATGASGSQDAAAKPSDFDDPAPPVVNVLEPMTPPHAEAFDGLTFHKAPAPLTPGVVTESWPQFLGPHRNGHSRETNLRKDYSGGVGGGGPNLVWEMQCGSGFSCPVVSAGRLVFAHRVRNETHVDCLDAETGRRYWRYSYSCDFKDRFISNHGPRSTPVIDAESGRVYMHGVQDLLHCLDLATGRVIWKRNLKEEFGMPQDFFGVVSSPLIHNDLLIINLGASGNDDSRTVVAFDKMTGRIVWGVGDEWGPSCASPVIAQAQGVMRLFVLAGGDSRPPVGGLMVMDPDTGVIDFTYPFRSRAHISVLGASPIVAENRVFLSAAYNTGTAGLSLLPDGEYEELWKTRRVGMEYANPIYVDGHLYVVDGASDRVGSIVCFAPESGDILSRTDLTWEEDLVYRGRARTLPMSVGEGSLLHADGSTMCLGDNGHLLWLDMKPEGAKVLSRASLFRANESWTPPVLSHGLLYVRQNTTERFGHTPARPRLMCYDLRAGGE